MRAKFARGDVLNWTGGNVRLKRPIAIGLFFDGSVFEGDIHATTVSDCGRNGMTFRNDGPKDDTGMVSAIAIVGGQLRKNGNAGIETQSAVHAQEPRDLTISQTYFVENRCPGLHATACATAATGPTSTSEVRYRSRRLEHSSLGARHSPLFPPAKLQRSWGGEHK